VRKPSLEDVGRQIAALRSTKRAIGNYPGVRHSLDWRTDVLLTALADNDEWMDAGRGAVEHETSIGEYKANIKTSFDLTDTQGFT
jgi:hypothetical protein